MVIPVTPKVLDNVVAPVTPKVPTVFQLQYLQLQIYLYLSHYHWHFNAPVNGQVGSWHLKYQQEVFPVSATTNLSVTPLFHK